MLSVPEALETLLAAVEALDPVELPLGDALGRTLCQRVDADRDFPPTDRSAMDGFALRASDVTEAGRTLRVVGEVRAGRDPAPLRIEPGGAARIFTGAVLPEGADTVVMVELTVEDRATATVRIDERPEAGQHIRRRGEDRAAGAPIVAAGTTLRPAEVAALAAVGVARVRVVRPPRVAVISTGDEVVEIEATPAPHQVRNSNARMLLAQLGAMGLRGTYLGTAPDDPSGLDAAIAEGLGHDVLLLTGGVSVGEYDLVGAALARAGCHVLFHRVAMRPGKPILVAQREAALVLGLPGNPVSAFTGFHVFVGPALRKLSGSREPVPPLRRAVLLERLRRRPGRLSYVLASLDRREGQEVVTPVRSASSGDVLSLVRANAFIVAEGSPHAIEAGEAVDVVPWDVL